MTETTKIKTPSAREQLAERFAAWIREHDLCQVFGGDVTRSVDRRSYGVLFSRCRTLDGLVRVYSPTFILVETTRLGREKFSSEAEAFAYLERNFL
jgi:hypothetical protein